MRPPGRDSHRRGGSPRQPGGPSGLRRSDFLALDLPAHDIDNTEIIQTVRQRPEPMIPAS